MSKCERYFIGEKGIKLSRDKTKYISKFDKANGVCSENRNVYVQKIINIIDDAAHFRPFKMNKRVKKDPLVYAEEKFNREIHKLQTSCQIKNEIYDQIRGTDHHQPDFMVCQKCIKIS